jgi:hypothetical protein
VAGEPTVGRATPASGATPAFASARGWPQLGDLQYVKEAITVLLLVLALPWLALNLVRRPQYVLAGAGRQHIKGT